MKQFSYSQFQGCVETRIGGRAENQDSFGYYETPLGLLIVVCDGMGGGPGGKTASSLAVETIIQQMMSTTDNDDAAESLENAIQYAHAVLLRTAQGNPALKGMGTTVAALLINEYAAYSAHIGDSRVYQFRCGRKKFRTFDHSMVFEMLRNKAIKNEEVARLSYQSNVITQALGASASINVDIDELPYEKGDRFMLCSDGIWGSMKEDKLIKMATQPRAVSGACEGLVIEVDRIGAAEGGRHDNLTVALLDTSKDSIKEEKMNRKTRMTLLILAIICGISVLGNIIQAVGGPEKEIEKLKEENACLNSDLQNLNTQLKELSASHENISKNLQSSEQNKKDLEDVVKVQREMLNKQNNSNHEGKEEILEKFDELIDAMTYLIKNPSKRTTKEAERLQGMISELQEECKAYGITMNDWKKHKGRDLKLFLNDKIATRNSEGATNHYKTLVKVVEDIKDKINKK